MDRIVEREDVWAAVVEDRSGALANKLTALAEAGADLDFMIARRAPDRPGTGVVFITPLRGDREIRAATAVGFSVASGLHSVRIEGPNEPGAAAVITRLVAKAGISVRGLSGAVMGTRYVLHLAFDTAEDSQKAIQLLQ